MQQNYRRIIFFISLIAIIIGMPFSKPMVSMGEMLLVANWFFDKNILIKFRIFLHNKIAVIFSSLFLLLIIGLFWSNNLEYGLFDLRTKLPLIIFPIVFSSEQKLNSKEIKYLLLLFVLSVFVSASLSFINYLITDVQDVRNAVLFLSHIRLSIMVVLSISILSYYLFIQKWNWIESSISIFAIIIFILELLMLEMMSGIILLFLSAVIISAILIFKSLNRSFALILSIIVVLFLSFTFFSTKKIMDDYETVPTYSRDSLPKFTINGNPYLHIPEKLPIENGSYIGLYICDAELKKSWEKRSKMCFDSSDLAGQPVSYTLTRFLNSKHLTKDSAGVSKLSDKEVNEIEKGIANVIYLENFSLRKRIYKILWEYNLYRSNGLAAGQSVIQRFELWKTGIRLFKQNALVGVGTGDIKDAFQTGLKQQNSDINPELGVHNQYIRMAVSFGIPGLLLFVFILFSPLFFKSNEKNWLYLSFLLTLAISMLWEDTLETQIGVTIYAFFNSFYWFYFGGKNSNINAD